ncbi:MAG TPA: response regulator, partial [Vicinamibacterales bacterium]|nr:response regulator [Vicinamibacterales bacterium]
ADEHEHQLAGLVQAAESDMRDAEATLVRAQRDASTVDGDRLRASSARLNRSRQHVTDVRRACVSAREQHVAARRLLHDIDGGDAGALDATHATRAAGVLVVDDMDDNRELVASLLQEAGFVVRTAVNGLDAVIAAYEMQPAVIVMDVTMPVLNGIEAARLIKASEATRAAKVIAYTATPSLPDPLIARLFVQVLPKPSTADVLLAAVQTVASR